MEASPKSWSRALLAKVRGYFASVDPDLPTALFPFTLLSILLFTRHPRETNFIFDEQEALLANPYVRSVTDPSTHLRWIDAFHRDFWGLTPERTIGSYRPIPDLVWRFLWMLGARHNPFLHHWVNVVVHAFNGALLTVFVLKLTRDRMVAWLAGALFVSAAILTEAVSGVVGIADVLGGTGAIVALYALTWPLKAMVPAVFLATLFGLYSKESALACVPLVPLAALLTAPLLHPGRERRWLRTFCAALATVSAFILYVEARRRMFPTTHLPMVVDGSSGALPWLRKGYAAFLKWYAQPQLPQDPLNNPLVNAPVPYRIAGALRVYLRSLGQVFFPVALSGDYSAPQEPVPDALIFPESVLGTVFFLGPLVGAGILTVRDLIKPKPVDSGPIVAFALAWITLSYFPVSNIPIPLPTVRAERFWYFPILGISILLALTFACGYRRLERMGWGRLGGAILGLYFIAQCTLARRHANDYQNDLVFWNATRHAVPRSAKAHLNYSVMVGARGHLEERLEASLTALDLAPGWPMAHVYYADTLCRLHKSGEAIPHYIRGFELGPNESNLVALGLQCLWDEKALTDSPSLRSTLADMAAEHPGTWLEYLVRDVLDRGQEHGGVDPKYRPRAYNEGPKKD